ncbi:MAG: hypothetical protein HY902_13870 [Deltaproteobacteria bacterium]|nr:hypothetical protein [Deltaproteobacteria bacterium]
MLVHRTAPVLVCFAVALSATACVTASGGNNGGGGAAAIPVHGGAVASACQQEDQTGCAPGSLVRVRCQGGVWTQVQVCGAGEACIETMDKQGEVTATACAVPATTRESRAILCARASACVSKLSFQECMNPPSPALISKQIAVSGLAGPEDLLALQIDAQASCLLAAKDCKGVHACFASGVPACESDSADSCSGSVARLCSGGATYAIDCAKVGLPCTSVKSSSVGILTCGNLPTCSQPGTATCNGSVAQGCIGLDKSSGVSVKVDCAALGGTCSATGQLSLDPSAVCNLGPGGPCDEATFVPSCQGNSLKACVKGKLQQLDCSTVLATCEATAGSDGKTEVECTATPNCPSSLPHGCAGTVLHFCDGSLGARTFDCAKAGLDCSGGECQF